ncbi:MAG: glycosyltransferase family 4 protein [Sphaerochaetaceae bacterium]
MRILLTSDAYKPITNGVVTSLVNLQQGLSILGHEVRILTLSQTHTTYYQNGVWYLSSWNSGRIYPGTRVRDTLGKKTIRDIINWKPEVVHSHCEFSTFSLARHIAQVVGVPLLHTYHTLYEDYTNYFSPSKRLGQMMAQRFSRNILEKVDCIIAPTTKIERLLRSYGVTKLIRVIPSGIDLAKFSTHNQKGDTNALRTRYGIPKENQVVIYVGRLATEKRVHELLANFSHEKKNRTLLLVGDGPQRESLEQLSTTLGLQDQVKFAGMQKQQDIPSFYHMGDVFCSASTSETQGLTYVEALASGLPVLCRADECLDDVIQDGVNGWQYQTLEEYHQYLDHICDDETIRKTLSMQALESSKRYARETYASAVSALYEQRIQRYRIVSA